MSSKTFRIILAGDSKDATKAIDLAKKSGDSLISSAGSWGSKWASTFSSMGQKLSEFGSKFSQADGWKAKLNVLRDQGSSALTSLGQKFSGVGQGIRDFGATFASADGWKAKLAVLGDQGGAALAGLGSKFAGLGLAAGAAGIAVGAAVVGLVSTIASKMQEAGQYVYDLGEKFYAAQSTIRIGTGATGAALEDLKGSYYDVYEQTAASSAEVSRVIADLNTRLGLTGDPLEALSLSFLRFSKLTGTDLSMNIQNITRVFGDWGVTAEQQAGTMDMLFRAWQATGIPVERLTTLTVQYGASLRGLGYDLQTSTAMVAKWDKEGVNTELVMGGLRKAFAAFSQEYGPNAQAEFQRFMAQIAAAPNASTAAQIAMEKLGVKIGADFAAAVGEGRFEYGGLVDQIAGGSETLKQAAVDTGTWRGSLTMMTHTLERKLAPVAETVFGGINSLVRNNVMPIFRDLSAAWDEGGFEGVMQRLPVVFELVKIKIGEWWDTLSTWWTEKGPELMRKLGDGIRLGLVLLGGLAGVILEKLGEWLPAFGEWIQNTAVPYVQENWGKWWKAFTDWFGEFAPIAIQKLGEFLGVLTTWVVTDAIPWALATGWEMLISLVKWLGTDGIPTMIFAIGELLGAGIEWIETEGVSWISNAGVSMWNGLVHGFVVAVNSIIDIWNGLSFTLPEFLGGGTIDSPDVGRIVRSSPSQQGTLSGPARRGDPLKGFPGFADGAVVRRPTLAWVGEDSRTTPEIVSPQRLMYDTVAKAIADKLGSVSTAGGHMTVQVVLDRRVIGEAMVDIAREMRMRG